jgi:hypothetical protein
MAKWIMRRSAERWDGEDTLQPGTVTPEEFRRIVEERVRDRFHMSLLEFAEAFRAGKLGEDPAALDLAVVSGASARRN